MYLLRPENKMDMPARAALAASISVPLTVGDFELAVLLCGDAPSQTEPREYLQWWAKYNATLRLAIADALLDADD